jgi:hypothetical protein
VIGQVREDVQGKGVSMGAFYIHKQPREWYLSPRINLQERHPTLVDVAVLACFLAVGEQQAGEAAKLSSFSAIALKLCRAYEVVLRSSYKPVPSQQKTEQ